VQHEGTDNGTRYCRKYAALLPGLDVVRHHCFPDYRQYHQFRSRYRSGGCRPVNLLINSDPSLVLFPIGALADKVVLSPEDRAQIDRISAEFVLSAKQAGGPALLYCVLFTLVSVVLEIRIPYQTYSGILKWMTLSLFTYVGTIFVVQINWPEVIRGTFIPTISFKGEYLPALIAVLGTTISPYLLFWQAGEEVEQMESEPKGFWAAAVDFGPSHLYLHQRVAFVSSAHFPLTPFEPTLQGAQR